MRLKNIYQNILKHKKSGKKLLAVLIDPDKINDSVSFKKFIRNCELAKVDFLFVGGSLIINAEFEECISKIKSTTQLPLVIFPGSPFQISKDADALLFLSLISGRNAELLIGNHVIATPYLKKSGVEVISTGYMIVDCGNSTTSSYMSQSLPIPFDKPEIASVTAMAGEMLGMKLIYIDGGSGAQKIISEKMVQQISKSVSVPIIVGGGIKNYSDAKKLWRCGADIIVIGTLFEKNPESILTFSKRK